MIEMRASFLDVHGDSDWVGDDEPCEKSRVPGGSVVRHVVLGQSSRSLRCREQSVPGRVTMAVEVACVTRLALNAAMVGVGRERGRLDVEASGCSLEAERAQQQGRRSYPTAGTI